MKATTYLFMGSIAFLLVGGYCVYSFYPKELGNTQEAMALSAVVLTGLFLIVVLMAALVIVYQVLGLSDSQQALALPEGSVRAFLALSLVLVFVCLASPLVCGRSQWQRQRHRPESGRTSMCRSIL
jgi:uncharacterized membrane protein